MKEEIVNIAKSIQRHRDLELSISATNPSYGRVAANYNHKETLFWITNKENKGGVQFKENITGAISGTEVGNRTTITEDGKTIYKNTKIGEILILNHEGKHIVNSPGGNFDLEIFNRSSYVPVDYDGEYAVDILLKLSSDTRTHTFQNIAQILSLQADIDSDKERLITASEDEAIRLIRRIDEKEETKLLLLNKAQSFIRKYAELRYQPILDPIQETIKRSKIFNGPLIINGGPGTGKTTSLIQRIKFLISPSIEEYINLNQTQKDILYNQKTSWVFFSPNELLALFLRNSMKLEELSADTERVKVWSSHKNELMKAYKLVDTTTKRPFLIYNKSQNSLIKNKSNAVKNTIKNLLKFYIESQQEKINKITEIDTSIFYWKNTGQSIQKFILDKKKISNIDELIRLFLNLNETYKSDSEKISDEYSTLIKQVVGRIQVNIVKDEKRSAILSSILSNWKNSTQDSDNDEDDDENEIELEDFDEKEDQTFDFEKELFTKLKSLCRKQALKQFDKNTKFSKRERELIFLIPESENQSEFEQIGQTAFFKKNFERITKGILANILREIPMIYKKFRRKQLVDKNSNYDLKILEDLVKKDRNSRVHSDEQALLLYFINNICNRLYNNYKKQFRSNNHSYLTAYKTFCKPVIGIDEATDFSVIDLLAMNSFAHPDISSVTLSGDIMQRMTDEGLKSWEDFSKIVKAEKKDLIVSYRQSPTLLALAQAIYQKSTDTPANYSSYIEKDDSEPKPLIIVSEDEDEKLYWISERIIEIYKSYGDTIPSIAIFLAKEDQLENFAKKLGNVDTLADVGIFVKACRNGEVLGDKNTVRIFSIDKIKGLEFEAVFFHNIDSLKNQELANDLLLKYLYVGLSRATFYLGLTLSVEFDNELDFLSANFERGGKLWKN